MSGKRTSCGGKAWDYPVFVFLSIKQRSHIEKFDIQKAQLRTASGPQQWSKDGTHGLPQPSGGNKISEMKGDDLSNTNNQKLSKAYLPDCIREFSSVRNVQVSAKRRKRKGQKIAPLGYHVTIGPRVSGGYVTVKHHYIDAILKSIIEVISDDAHSFLRQDGVVVGIEYNKRLMFQTPRHLYYTIPLIDENQSLQKMHQSLAIAMKPILDVRHLPSSPTVAETNAIEARTDASDMMKCVFDDAERTRFYQNSNIRCSLRQKIDDDMEDSGNGMGSTRKRYRSGDEVALSKSNSNEREALLPHVTISMCQSDEAYTLPLMTQMSPAVEWLSLPIIEVFIGDYHYSLSKQGCQPASSDDSSSDDSDNE